MATTSQTLRLFEGFGDCSCPSSLWCCRVCMTQTAMSERALARYHNSMDHAELLYCAKCQTDRPEDCFILPGEQPDEFAHG